MFRSKFFAWLAATSLVLLASCGGNDSSPALTSVKVMGDSLSDSGVFGGLPAGSGYGRIFSVQASPGVTTPIWTERLATQLGAPALCSFYKFTGATFTSQATCGSFAVGGGRINNRYKTDSSGAAPFSIPTQLATAAALGNYKSSDLLLIDGGGNDAADLVGAYLGATADSGAAFSAIVTSTLTPNAAVVTAMRAADLPTAGTLYMQVLADEFYDSIKTHALNKDATHVTVLNIPAITKTPRFQTVLTGVEQSAGAAARAGAEALFNAWIQAFNTKLASNIGADKRVVLVDFYAAFLDQVARPSQYGLTNVTTPACPAVGAGADGLPVYNFETCTAASLSSSIPVGQTSADWWRTYAFSDGFHPTPYGHELMSQQVTRSLMQAGWIR